MLACEGAQCTQAVGIRLVDTVEFNDYTSVIIPCLRENKLPKLASVTVFYDSSSIYGVACGYKFRKCSAGGMATVGHISEQHKTKTKIREKQAGKKTQKILYTLKPKEFITEVFGKYANGITRLQIKTNRGNAIDAGSSLGNDFQLLIPAGKQLLAFAGGFGTSLHNIAAYFIDPSST